MSVKGRGVEGREGKKGRACRTTFEAINTGAKIIAQIVRSGETKGQANVRRNTSATPLQLHTKLLAHLDMQPIHDRAPKD